jgi:hypothetical protein
MFGWLTILFAILRELPTLYNLYKLIRELMKDETPEVKTATAASLKEVVTSYRADQDKDQAAGKLKEILHDLQERRQRRR